MAKYLMLKHYRMPAEYMDFTPMEEWSPDEVDAHIAYMNAFADRLREAGELVDSQALSPEGTFVQSGGDGPTSGHRRPVPRDQGPHRRLDGHRRRFLRACPRTRRRALGRTGQGRAADQRMARTAPLPRPGAERR
jgi:hypothetical protein